MLQKLEDFYLGTLRFVVILIATLLLVAMFVLGMKATSITQEQPEPSTASPSVSVASLKSAVIETQLSEAPAAGNSTTAAATPEPNDVYFMQTAQAIHKFLDRVYPGQYNVDDQSLSNFVKAKVAGDRTDERQTLLAKELARAFPGLLAEPALGSYAASRDPNDILTKALEAFATEFDRQLAEVDEKNQATADRYLADQAEARRNLMLAGYSFGVFLLIVFLSIIIRIERNLRPVPNS